MDKLSNSVTHQVKFRIFSGFITLLSKTYTASLKDPVTKAT